MKHARIQILVGFFLTVATVLIFRAINIPVSTGKLLAQAEMAFLKEKLEALEQDKIDLQREGIALEKAKLQDKKTAIPVWRNIKYGTGVGASVSLTASLLLLSLAYRQKMLTHVLKIGANEIPVKDKDLSKLAPEVSTSLALAQTLEAQAPQRAFELYTALAEVNTRQLKALAGRVPQIAASMPVQEIPALSTGHILVPTFQDLLSSGEIAQGKPLLFGLNDAGEPKRGTWQDLYSSAIAGQSGNGKSSTARSLVLQSLLTGEIEAFYIADPHRHKQQGLINTLGPVINLPNVIFNETNFDIHAPINAFAVRMQRRIAGLESCERPIVLVIDELLSVIKNVSGTGKTVKKIGTEGRGFGCFGLFLAQSWVGADVGGTATRDNLTSLLVHRLKKKQASTLLQDSEWAKVASKLGRGEIVFESTSDDPFKLSVPLCTPADAITVYGILTDGNTVKLSGGQPGNIDGYFLSVSRSTQAVDLDTIPVNIDRRVDHAVAPKNKDVDLVEQVNTYLEKPGNTLRELAKSTGIDKGFLSKILNGKKAMSENTKKKLTTFFSNNTLQTADVIDLIAAREKKERD